MNRRRPIFLDASFYVAFIFGRDALHGREIQLAPQIRDLPQVTSQGVILEFLNFFARYNPQVKLRAVALAEELLASPNIQVEELAGRAISDGIDLYRRRLDKAYSLTDCISMLISRRHGIEEVATSDRNFEQEGFAILLKAP